MSFSTSSIPSLFSGLFALFLLSCAPQKPEPNNEQYRLTEPKRADPHPGNTAPPPDANEQVAPRLTNAPDTWPLEVKRTTVAGAPFTYLSFDTREHTLAVIDQLNGPGSEYQSAEEVASATKALAAINGGFFTPAGRTLGLAYEKGERIGSLNNSSSLGSGVVYVDRKLARPVILRRATFEALQNNSAADPLELLQSGPFLVENSKPVTGLSKDNERLRSLLLWDGEYHFAFAQCGEISLANLGAALAKQPLEDFKITSALNLDGGRSADFHITSRVSGGPQTLRRWWNKPVRNHLIALPQ
jgi:uncharacterized protein YigE (DUF2233 family)